MLSLLGFYLGAMLISLYIFAIILAGVLTIFMFGALCEKWIMKKETIETTWRTLIWGLLVGTIISLIPIIGWLIACVVFLSTLGSMMMSIRNNPA
jgi:uncharacterized membrane protein